MVRISGRHHSGLVPVVILPIELKVNVITNTTNDRYSRDGNNPNIQVHQKIPLHGFAHPGCRSHLAESLKAAC